MENLPVEIQMKIMTYTKHPLASMINVYYDDLFNELEWELKQSGEEDDDPHFERFEELLIKGQNLCLLDKWNKVE